MARNVVNDATTAPELEAALAERLAEVSDDPDVSPEHPRIRAWYDAYESAGLPRNRQTQPSVATLVRRIKKGGPGAIRFISPLVCVSNLVSLRHLVPSGVIDSARVGGDLKLRFAVGDESFAPISGDAPTTPRAGEVVYVDDPSGNVLCRGWNTRAGVAGRIEPVTRDAVLDVDGLTRAVREEEILEAARGVADLLARHCSADVTVHLLTSAWPQFALPGGSRGP